MFLTVLAVIGLVTCLVLLLRLALPPRRQQAFDAAARHMGRSAQDLGQGLLRWRPGSRKTAARVAEEAIERARRMQTDREGNVYRPKQFKGPRKDH